MANETDVRPALTAEEWRETSVNWGGENMGQHYQIAPYLIDGELSFDCDDSHYQRECTPHQRHQVAALALHGQPFGFTHDDVKTLGDCIADLCSVGEVPPHVMRLVSITERIRALLPPNGH